MDLRGAKDELVDKMHADGWVRLGVMAKRLGREQLFASGTRAGLAARRRDLADLGTCLGMEVVAERVGPEAAPPCPPLRPFGPFSAR